MTKKDFEAIARILSAHTGRNDLAEPLFDSGWISAAREVSLELAHYMGQDNPNFDRARFLKACGIGG